MHTATLAMPLVPLQLYSPEHFAMGVMVVPSNFAYRDAARQTWLNEAAKHAITRFVAGNVLCAHTALDREAVLHGDIVFVRSDDCQKWHSPAKIHAWYAFALRSYPEALWIAKMEDDGMCAGRDLHSSTSLAPPAQFKGVLRAHAGFGLNHCYKQSPR